MPSRATDLRHQSRYADPTPSRRASRVDVRRDEAGDAIEEDQNAVEDDDEGGVSDNEAPSSSRRHRSGAGASSSTGDDSDRRGQGSSRRTAKMSEDPAPQPLTMDSVALLKPSVRAWDDASSRLATVKGYYRETSATYAECNGDEGEERLEALDADFKELIDMTVESKIRKAVMNDIVKSISQGEEITDAKSQYETAVNEAMQHYRSKTQRQRYLGVSAYKDYKEAVWEAYKEEAMPPLTEFLPAESGDQEDDDEFAIGGVRMEYKCPLTMAILEEPVTNPACRHSYSKAAIMEYIATQRRNSEAARCPRSGCDKQLSERTLKDDKELEKKVKAFTRRMEMRTESRRTQATQILD